LRKTIRAAAALERTLLTEIDPSLMKLSAVIVRKEHLKRFYDRLKMKIQIVPFQ
jgi:hypothetical protein